jgi:hypothetical protein
MNDKEQLIASLASTAFSLPGGLIPRLRRAPNSLRWRLIIGSSLLKREVAGIVHRLQGRRIVHFLQIPKTGGTAVRNALKGYEIAGDHEIVFHKHKFLLNDVPRGEKFFFFLRDPIKRFVSAFYYRQSKGKPPSNDPWKPREELAYARFSTPNELALALSSDDLERRAAAVDAMKSLAYINEPHWAMFKSEFYFLSRKSDILFIGFQDTLNDDFALLKRILNLPEEVRLPEDEAASNRNTAQVDRRLDEQAFRNLRTWYARDYRFLDLCREMAARIRSDWEQSSLSGTVSQPLKTAVGAP